MVNTNKYYCKVVTRNFPVNITPIISRYTQITKYLDILQIAMCLKSQATVDIIDVKDDKKWKDPNLSRTEFIDQVNSRWQIFGDLINDIEKEFKGYIDYDGDKFDAQIYFINKDNE